MLDRLLRSDQLPETGGTPTTVLISIDHRDLIARAGLGRFADGSPISAAAVADLIDQADIAWCVKNRQGAVLDLHRDRRIASPAQTLALIARDGGCSFPGVRREALVDRVEVEDLHRGPVAAGLS
jgi:hypothetical protein